MEKLKRYLFLSLLMIVVVIISACGNNGIVENNYQILTIEKTGEGETTPVAGNHDIEKGTIVSLEAVAASEWQFVRWEGSVVDSGSANTTIYMDSDKTVRAVFEEPQSNLNYQILTMEKTGEGEIIPVAGNHDIEKGTIVSLEAVAASGWQFVRWEGSVADTESANTTVYMDSDKNVKAIFEDETTEVPGIINGSNSTVNLNGNIDYEKKLDYDLILNKNLDISFAGIKLDIILKDYQENPVDDGDYLVSIASNLDGNIIDKELSFSNGIATIDFNLLSKGEHLLTVIVDSMTITTDFSIDIQDSDLYLAGGNIDLNGYELNINSNFYHESGNILVNSGKLTVNKDYRLQTKTDNEGYDKSSGILKMINADDFVLVKGDFITQSSSSHTDYLLDGVIEIKGDFEQIGNSSAYGNYSRYNFNASGTHKIIFSGNNKQNISFESTLSGFALMDFANSDLDFLTLVRGGTLAKNAELDNSLNYGFKDKLNLNGKELIINGDFIQTEAATIDFNSGDLKVNGNLIQESGTFNIANGSLNIDGDYRLQNQEIVNNQKVYSNSSAFLVMNNSNDYVGVTGDFIMQSSKSHSNFLTAGILEIKGDFEQIGNSAAFGNYSRYNFDANGSHKVVFSGDILQNISYETATGSGFALADLDNSNLNFSTAVRGWKLEKDSVIANSVFYGFAGEFDLNGKELIIDGHFVETVDGTMDLNGGKFIVKGNFYQPTGTLKVNKALVMIEGDYRLQTTTLERGNGKLIMLEEEDYILVKGSFATHSTSSHENNLKDGLLEVKGNFYQIGNSAAYGNYSRSNFEATEDHRVILSGENQQTVSFAGLSQSKFAILTVVNGGNNRVVFNTNYNLDRRSDATLNTSYLELNPNSSEQLSADFIMENSGENYWLSRNTNIAIVSNDGLVQSSNKGYTAIKITCSTDQLIFIYSFVEVN